MEDIRFKDYLQDYLDFNNISQNEFARRIGITPKTLIDILSGNSDLSLKNIEAISFVTDIPVDYICKIELNYKLNKNIKEYLNDNHLTITNYLNKFDYKYLIENKWINFVDKEDKYEIAKDILKYLRVMNPKNIFSIDENIFYKSKNDKPELKLLWLEKCYRLFLEQSLEEYKKENINILVSEINNMAKNNLFNEKVLVQLFNKNGVGLVIEDDIPGSKISGAFKVHRNKPVIYITRKHNRIADIYFALFHELAHLKTDYNKAKSTNIISYFDDNLEENADITAFNWMVDNKYYNDVVKKQSYNICKETSYPKSFVVYRLAHDKIINYSSDVYQKYNKLLNKQ